MSQPSLSRKRKARGPSAVDDSATAATTPMTPTDDSTPHMKRQRDQLTPINYFDLLPKDVLSHLFIYLKLLDDEEMYSLGKTSRSMLSFIQTRYDRSGLIKWYLYRLGDIEASELKLPWTTPEERNRYVLFSPKPKFVNDGDDDDDENGDAASDSALSEQSMNEEESQEDLEEQWVIIRHAIDMDILIDLKTLPLESFVLNEYQPSRFAIGQITRLRLCQPSATFFNLPHLKFLPSSTSLKQLALTDVLVNSPEVIQTYGWPQRLQNIKLKGFHSHLLSREMISRWPSTLKHLSLGPGELGYDYSQDLPSSEICIPLSVEHLYIHNDFRIDPAVLQLPPGLRELTCTPRTSLGSWTLPASLTTLHLGDSFIDRIDECILPPTLSTFTIGEGFDESLTRIRFNQTLTHLHLGGFNRSLLGVTFPFSLIHLEFGPSFQQTLLGVALPQGLKTLIYGEWIDGSIRHPEFSLPSSITHLELGRYQFATTEDEDKKDESAVGTHQPSIQLPPNLQYLQLPVFILFKGSRLPVTIEELVITSRYQDYNSDYSHLNEILGAMPVLRDLSLSLVKISVKSLILPPTLEQFEFAGSLLEPFVDTVIMGPKLKRVIFGEQFDESLNGVKFPDSIEFIQFKHNFDQPIDEVVFPASLREVHFGKPFNQPLDQVVFPSGLESISLIECSWFTFSLVHCKLPSSLKQIQLSPFYDCSLSGFILPPGLERFEMGLTDQPSQFKHIDSLIGLQFPSTIKLIRLPNPHQASYRKHPSLGSYQEWLTSLSHLHPYAHIQFSRHFFDHEEEEEEEEEDNDACSAASSAHEKNNISDDDTHVG